MRLSESFQYFFFYHFEWVALTTAILIMAFIDPSAEHKSICPIEFFGIPFCPGEGFGRSVALFFRGSLIESFQMHPAGIPGIFIISHRIYTLIKRNRSFN